MLRCQVCRREMGVHLRTSRVRVNLDKHLPDQFPSQPLTNLRQIPSRTLRASFAVKAGIVTDARICVHR